MKQTQLTSKEPQKAFIEEDGDALNEVAEQAKDGDQVDGIQEGRHVTQR